MKLKERKWTTEEKCGTYRWPGCDMWIWTELENKICRIIQKREWGKVDIIFLTIYIRSQSFHHDEIIVWIPNTKSKLSTHRKFCFFLLLVHSRLFPSVIERIFFFAVMIRMEKRDWHNFDTHQIVHILFTGSGDSASLNKRFFFA